MKLLLFCNTGFEMMEFAPFVDVFGWARNDYDALAIPGGFEDYDFYKEAYDSRFLDLISSFDAKGKYIASVCVGALPGDGSGCHI